MKKNIMLLIVSLCSVSAFAAQSSPSYVVCMATDQNEKAIISVQKANFIDGKASVSGVSSDFSYQLNAEYINNGNSSHISVLLHANDARTGAVASTSVLKDSVMLQMGKDGAFDRSVECLIIRKRSTNPVFTSLI